MRQAIIMGRAGSDGELAFTPSGAAKFTFSVAVKEKKYNAQNDQPDAYDTYWFNIIAWKYLAEKCKETVKKGAMVTVIGRILPREWTDSASGKKMKVTEIIADRIEVSVQRPKKGGDNMITNPGSETMTDDQFFNGQF